MAQYGKGLLFIFTLLPFLNACGGRENTQEKNQGATMKILAGTYTQGKSEGIYRLSFDPATGALVNEGLAVKAAQPSFVAAGRDVVYAVNETDTFNGQPGGGLSAFRWKEGREQLTPINSQNTEGAHPCYLSLSGNGRYLSVANYTGGNVALFELSENGALLEGPVIRQHSGSGPNPERQEGPHAHCALWRPDGQYLYVVDLGIDEVVAYAFNPETGTLGPGNTALEVAGGSGPRLLTFHPEKKLAFLVNELSCTVLSLSYEEGSPSFSVIQEESTLPAGFAGENTCAHIQISPDGRFLYASNRGHDSIAAYSVSPEGKLTRVDIEPTQGRHPRYFTISPDGRYLLAANRDSDSVVVFRIDQESGALEPTGTKAEVYSPVCLQFVE